MVDAEDNSKDKCDPSFYPTEEYQKNLYANANYEKYKMVPTLTVYKDAAAKTKAFFWENTVTLKIFGCLICIFAIVIFASILSAVFKICKKESSLFRYRVLWMILSLVVVFVVLYKLDL
jgi:hypothetical protein